MQIGSVFLAAVIIGIAFAAIAAPAAEQQSLPEVREKMQQFVDQREIAGAVTLVTNRDRTIYLDACGLADIAANKPMKPETIVWIASMTKPITGTAVMMLQDEGKLNVLNSVSKYIPELSRPKTSDGKIQTVTIRHLLTHTSGMGEIDDTDGRKCKTLADVIPYYASRPLNFEPGSRWAYCQSGINTAARIVEVVSGQTFPDFVENRLFKPLGMKDTTFYLSESQFGRLSKSYSRTPAGELQEATNFILLGKNPMDRDRFPAANGGLFSTAEDYARFCRMILNKGTVGGKRYLKPETVEFMTSVRSGDVQTGFTPGNGWGLGWCVIREPQGVTSALSPGSHGHGGAYGTQAWIDPVKGVAYILMVQRSNFPNSDASDVRKAFQQAAADAMHH